MNLIQDVIQDAGEPNSVPRTASGTIVAPKSKADTTNPKDLLGVKKVSLTKVPSVAVAHLAHAMMNGASKYGPYNWRDKEVQADIYVDAAMRHLWAWFEGEETAEDSLVHHLGHAMACCAILLDAQESGKLVDNRPICDDPEIFSRVANRIADRWKQYQESLTKETENHTRFPGRILER